MKRVSPSEAHELVLDQGYVYLDVRSVPEFDTGHPRGAYNVPLMHAGAGGERPDFVRDVRSVFSPDTKLVLSCKSGSRSLRAAELLSAAGFEHVVDQRAGMDGATDPFGRVRERGFRAEGLPVSVQAESGRSYAEILARRGT